MYILKFSDPFFLSFEWTEYKFETLKQLKRDFKLNFRDEEQKRITALIYKGEEYIEYKPQGLKSFKKVENR